MRHPLLIKFTLVWREIYDWTPLNFINSTIQKTYWSYAFLSSPTFSENRQINLANLSLVWSEGGKFIESKLILSLKTNLRGKNYEVMNKKVLCMKHEQYIGKIYFDDQVYFYEYIKLFSIDVYFGAIKNFCQQNHLKSIKVIQFLG